MSKGRNTTVIAVRVPDEMHREMSRQADIRKMLLSDWLRALIGTQLQANNGRLIPVGAHETPMTELSSDGMSNLDAISGVCSEGTNPRPNDPCPCGAVWPEGHLKGQRKKYKHCCGRMA